MRTTKPVNKIVLAYSGGLDTSIIIHWLKQTYRTAEGNPPEVIAAAADVGQGAELEGLRERAIACGAADYFALDLTAELCTDYIFPMVQAGAVYENDYLLGTAIARPVIAKALCDVAKREGADAICHGCTGKGNDQVRFEMGIMAYAPELTIIAPWREWDLRSREDEWKYAQDNNIALPAHITPEGGYSKDRNIWHLSHEGLDLEDPKNAPDYPAILELGVDPERAAAEAETLTIRFEKGVPVGLDGDTVDPVTLLQTLNTRGGKHGIGIADLVENRLVGMKSRGVYETPGGTILMRCHRWLEQITVDRETARQKDVLAQKYAELVYNGQWFTPLREALDAFVRTTQEHVTGWVKVKLYRGNIIFQGMDSPHSLYDTELASFGESAYNHTDAGGFIRLFGLGAKVAAKRG